MRAPTGPRTRSLGHDFRQAEETSVPVTLILLIGVFGALIAAGIPLLLAGTAVSPRSRCWPSPASGCRSARARPRSCCSSGWPSASTTRCSTCAGSGRNGPPGRAPSAALRIAAATSGPGHRGLRADRDDRAGRAVPDRRRACSPASALGTIAVVGVAVVGSLTFLPALLSWLGPWADRGRIPFLGRRRTAARPSRLWAALVRRVVRHPAAWGAVAALAHARAGRARAGPAAGQPGRRRVPASLPIVPPY